MRDNGIMRQLKCRCGGTMGIMSTLAGVSLCDANETPIGAVIECECPICRQRITLTDWFYVPNAPASVPPEGDATETPNA